MKKTATILLTATLTLLFSSCAFIKLQEDLDNIADTGTIYGKITHQQNKKGPIVLIAYNEKNKIVQYKILYKDADFYAFMLPIKQNYKIAAFDDANKNMQWDAGEPVSLWLNPQHKILQKGKNLIVNISLAKSEHIPSYLALDIKETNKSIADKCMITTGAIADLDNEKFSEEAGHKALWTPFRFIEKNGLGVYFMEKYDPTKIPILFVYGIGGYPQSWKTFFKDIDRSRYQPWFYYYPSGFRIESAGKALDIIMKELQMKYKFKKLFIVAHSMGGLVSYEYIRRYLAENKNKENYIKLFISISTPWAGDKDAEWAQQAPAIIPCWKDLMPSSPFIQKITPATIAPDIDYYLLFSFHGDRKPFRLNNDHIVYLNSVLRFDMQKRAKKIYGFDFTHTEILHHKDVIGTCNEIFNSCDKHK